MLMGWPEVGFHAHSDMARVPTLLHTVRPQGEQGICCPTPALGRKMKWGQPERELPS